MRRLLFSLIGTLLLTTSALAQTWPNEPPGSTVMWDVNWNTNTPTGWCAVNCGAGIGTITTESAGNMLSPPNVLYHQFNPSNHLGNGGNHTVPFAPVDEIYVGHVVRNSDPFQGYFNCTNKFYYFWLGNRDSNFIVQIRCGSGGQNDPIKHLAIQTHDTDNCHLPGDGDCPGTFNIYANRGSSVFVPGVYHKVEFYLKRSTRGTTRDGIIKWWIDGVLVGEHYNVNFPNCSPSPCSSPDQSWGITEIALEQAWDGSVDETHTNPDFWRYDHTRISAPSGGEDTTAPNPVTGITVE